MNCWKTWCLLMFYNFSVIKNLKYHLKVNHNLMSFFVNENPSVFILKK